MASTTPTTTSSSPSSSSSVAAMALYNLERAHDCVAALAATKTSWHLDGTASFDCMHYLGDSALHAAAAALRLRPAARVLDLGSGFGATGRFLHAHYAVDVTGVELQPEIHALAETITARNGMAAHVRSVNADITRLVVPAADAVPPPPPLPQKAEAEAEAQETIKEQEEETSGGNTTTTCPTTSTVLTSPPSSPSPSPSPFSSLFDHVVSFLCILHIPDRAAVFSNAAALLRPHGSIYLEDLYLRRRRSGDDDDDDANNTDVTPDESTRRCLRDTVSCPYLPGRDRYIADLEAAGFGNVHFTDMTAEWAAFVHARAVDYPRSAKVPEPLLQTFYHDVDKLFAGGQLGGARIMATKL